MDSSNSSPAAQTPRIVQTSSAFVAKIQIIPSAFDRDFVFGVEAIAFFAQVAGGIEGASTLLIVGTVSSFIRWIDSEVSFTSQFVVDCPPLQSDAISDQLDPGRGKRRLLPGHVETIVCPSDRCPHRSD
jgi:hypothetical protein